MTTDDGNPITKITRERENLLAQLQEWLEVPMLLLSIAWLALLITVGMQKMKRQSLPVPNQLPHCMKK